MPSIQAIERDKIEYIKGMEEYLQKLRAMPVDLARKKSRENLENCSILQKDGKLGKHYKYSRPR